MSNITDALQSAYLKEGRPLLLDAKAEIERLRAALKPFADTLDHIPGMNYRDDVRLSSEWVGAGKLTVGDLRRAAEALNQQQARENPK